MSRAPRRLTPASRPTYRLATLWCLVTVLGGTMALGRWLASEHNAVVVASLGALATVVGLVCGLVLGENSWQRLVWCVVGAVLGGAASMTLQALLHLVLAA